MKGKHLSDGSNTNNQNEKNENFKYQIEQFGDENSSEKNGAIMTGNLIMKSPKTDNPNSLNHPSTRLVLESWVKSNKQNNHYGDVMQMIWKNHGAKPFLGWWDGATNPESPDLKAWIGAHSLANNPNAKPHNHWSVEVSDEEGEMQTRLAIPFDKNHTNIKTSSSDFSVGYGKLRVGGSGNNDLEFAINPNGDPKDARFTLRMNSKQDFRIISRDDEGNPIGKSPFAIERLSGNVGMGITKPKSKLHVVSDKQAVLIEGDSTRIGLSILSLESKNKNSKVIGVKSKGDDDYSFLVNSNGSLEIGNGKTGVHASLLFNEEHSSLETDSNLIFQKNSGPILHDNEGGEYKLIVNTKGILDTIKL